MGFATAFWERLRHVYWTGYREGRYYYYYIGWVRHYTLSLLMAVKPGPKKFLILRCCPQAHLTCTLELPSASGPKAAKSRKLTVITQAKRRKSYVGPHVSVCGSCVLCLVPPRICGKDVYAIGAVIVTAFSIKDAQPQTVFDLRT
ncbi:hypothetical protein CGRA01v4_01167 [Colletotrichum graminicola]|nr:hypothetical protein CGRA01v4_01167 [Colletotrichum graminicola]